jgi:cobalt-zinc-cadmium efflux system outer membrane protein
MSALPGEKQSMSSTYLLCAVMLFLLVGVAPKAVGQQRADGPFRATSGPQGGSQPGARDSLRDLLAEAERNNPRLEVARQVWEAAKQVPSQVSTLPDPQFMVQQTNVGSPRPFAGYTNSEFAYVGLGVSQDLPYPGKLRLRGEMAKRDANAAQQQFEAARKAVLAEVKSSYFRLAYLGKTLGILESDGQLLEQMEKAADARYRSGVGNQRDLIEVQVERTRLLREITMHHLEAAKEEAQIKQLLNRPQSSPDIKPADLPNTPLLYTFDELLAAADVQNPEISGAEEMVERQKLQVDLAHKDFYPDFNVQYLWQRTDPTQFRAYYTLTVGVRVPLYRRRRQRPELAQAEADLHRSHSEAESQLQRVAFELRTEFDTEEQTAELVRIDQEGLLPQTRAAFQSSLVAYQSNRQDFPALLASFRDVLHADEEYWQTAADHETAFARLEEITGVSLREEGAQP